MTAINPISRNPARYNIIRNRVGVLAGIVADDNADPLPTAKLDQFGKYLTAAPFYPVDQMAKGTLRGPYIDILIYANRPTVGRGPGYWVLDSACADALHHPDVAHTVAAYSDTNGGVQATPVLGLDNNDVVISMVIGFVGLGRVDIAVTDIQEVIAKGLAVKP